MEDVNRELFFIKKIFQHIIYVTKRSRERAANIFNTKKCAYDVHKNKKQEEKSYEKRNYNNYSSRGCNNRKY